MVRFYVFILVFILLSISGFLFTTQNSSTIHKHHFEEPGKDNPQAFFDYHARIRGLENNHLKQIPGTNKLREWQKAKKRLSENTSISKSSNLDWVERGPGNVTGRAKIALFDPDDLSMKSWYVGSSGGGVWKTTDAGLSWINTMEDLPNLAIDELLISPANSDVLYATTGNYSITYGAIETSTGIWKSSNKGETWELLPSTINDDRIGAVSSMLLHPEDPNIIYIAARANPVISPLLLLLKSTDGGTTWSELLSTTDPLNTFDQVFANCDFSSIYTTVSTDGILKSNDGGASWQKIYDSLEGQYRIEAVVSKSDPDKIYAAIQDYSDVSSTWSTLMLTEDGGEHWYEVISDPPLPNWMGSQGGLNNGIGIDPIDDDIIYLGGQLHLLRLEMTDLVNETSQTRMASYRTLDNGGLKTHVDYFSFDIKVQDDKKHFLVSNDGGMAYSDDEGDTFIQTGEYSHHQSSERISKGLITSQFYGVDKMNGEDRYVGGTQDNGSWISPANADSQSDWLPAAGGDGFEALWNYVDPNLMLVSAQNNYISRSEDGGESFSVVNLPEKAGYGAFFTNLGGSKRDPYLVLGLSQNGVIRSTDFGKTWDLVPLDLSSNFGYIEVSLAEPDIVWLGLQLNEIYVSTDRGKTFTPTTSDLCCANISGVATHPKEPNTAYIMTSEYGRAKVFKTDNLGATWTDLSSYTIGEYGQSQNGYPDVATYCLLVMPYDENIIWVGTEIGLFESTDGGATWNIANNGSPNTAIWDMKIVNDQIVMATHGRGIWSLTVPELYEYEPLGLVVAPNISNVDYTVNNSNLSATYKLNAAYDSTHIRVEHNNLVIDEIKISGNTNAVIENVSADISQVIPKDTIATLEVQIVSFVDGFEILGQRHTIDAYYLNDEVITQDYQNNFDESVEKPFITKGLFINQLPNFSSSALETVHDLEGVQNSLAILPYPLLISENLNRLSFDQIILSFPSYGDGSYGSTDIGDFVVIEGSVDRGDNWDVLQGYDTREHIEWLHYFESMYDELGNKLGPDSDELFRSFKINLNQYYDNGEEVYLRIRDYRAGHTPTWGAVFDNIKIEGVPDNDGDGFPVDEDCDDDNPLINPGAEEIINNDIDEDCDGVAIVIDQDADGYNSDEDCNDWISSINPGVEEIPNNDIDENCDGDILIIDEDGDGFNSYNDCDDRDPNINNDAVEIANNNVDENCDGIFLIIDEDGDLYNSDQDCDDLNATIYPGAEEIPNNDIDEDCDGIALIIDIDEDGFNSDEDCDDLHALIYPGAEEIPNNDIDEDCDGIALIIDIDEDGFNSDEDCDDLNATIYPGAEEIPNNDIDEDCDGIALIIDIDEDGFNSDEDCDDLNATINPGAEEIPNNDIDEDCNGLALIIDIDEDGFNSDEDCDDLNATINPGAEEIPNNDIDEDCDGIALIIDIDGDGFNSDEDCDDSNETINPSVAEIPNNDIDEDCDGIAQVIDEDMDGYNSDEDCDDLDPNIYPGAPEILDNGIDEDCNGQDELSSSIFVIDGVAISIYPNPAREWINLDISQVRNVCYTIYDLKGNDLGLGDCISDSQNIDISSLSSNIYLIQITDTISHKKRLEKIIKL